MAVDKNGNVYVANQDTHEILVFAKGISTAFKTLSDPNNDPDDVAVASDGTVYVANEFGPGNIAVYIGGSTTPTRYITDPNFIVGVQSVAVDEHHLLAALYDDSNFQIDVDEFVGGRGHGKKVISTGLTGGSVRFDNAENLVVALDSGTGEINVYNGTTFVLCNSIAQPAIPSYIYLDKSNGDVFVPDVPNTVVHEETFGDCTGGGTIERNYIPAFSNEGVVSTAVDPGAAP